MPSLAQTQISVPASPEEASKTVAGVIRDLGYTLDEDYPPGGRKLLFYIKRTVLWVKRVGGVDITADGSGARIVVGIYDAPGQPVGVLDGKRNRKLVGELEDKIVAALGSG